MAPARAIGLSCLALLCCEAATGEVEPPRAAGPAPETIRAFENYVRFAASRLDAITRDPNGFLWAGSPELRATLRNAGIICEPRNRKGEQPVHRGLIHDWIGAVFIPGATMDQVLSVVQDYNNHKRIYAPDVMDSRILERNGADFKVRLRLFKRKVVTVVLDVDNEIRYERLAGNDWRSRSSSTRIVEIANAGRPTERERRPGKDRGYLWRLNSYWLFRERDEGVYVECEAISLSRSIPSTLAPLIHSIIKTLPKDALVNTLGSTRDAVLNGSSGSRGPRANRRRE